jgi:hypothetical protein
VQLVLELVLTPGGRSRNKSLLQLVLVALESLPSMLLGAVQLWQQGQQRQQGQQGHQVVAHSVSAPVVTAEDKAHRQQIALLKKLMPSLRAILEAHEAEDTGG